MKFNKVASLIAFLYLFKMGFSQHVIGPRSLSLAGNGVTLKDAYSVFTNAGLISEIKEIQVATSYSIPYLINEFQQQSIVGVLPLKKGGISFGGQFTGKELFKQQKISVGYGLKLNEKLSIGIGLNHQQLRVQNYEVNNIISVDAGFFANVNEKISIAASILSFGGNHTNINLERFPSSMQIGIRYAFQKQVQTYFSLDKSTISNVNYRIGLEYEAYKNLWFRTGGIINSKTVAFGFGYELPLRLRIDVGSQWQQSLGWTPNIGLLYRFSAKK
jgi:hypothetical protein